MTRYTILKRNHSYNMVTMSTAPSESSVVVAQTLDILSGVAVFYDSDGHVIAAFREWENITSTKEDGNV